MNILGYLRRNRRRKEIIRIYKEYSALHKELERIRSLKGTWGEALHVAYGSLCMRIGMRADRLCKLIDQYNDDYPNDTFYARLPGCQNKSK